MKSDQTSGEKIRHWEQEVRKRPKSPTAWYNLGLAYTTVGRMTSAEKAYRRAVELDPEFLRAWVNLGGTLLNQWRFKECLEAGKRAVDLGGDLPLVHFNMGQAYLYLGDAEGLLRCCRKVLELDPEHPAGNYYCAVGLLARKDEEQARMYLDRAMRLGHKPTPEFLKAIERVETSDPAVIGMGS